VIHLVGAERERRAVDEVGRGGGEGGEDGGGNAAGELRIRLPERDDALSVAGTRRPEADARRATRAGHLGHLHARTRFEGASGLLRLQIASSGHASHLEEEVVYRLCVRAGPFGAPEAPAPF